MSESLPQGSFRWLTEEEASALDVTKMTAEQSTGYIYEVDLKYPEHLHLDHNSFPLAPQHLVVKHSMLSPYAQKCHKLLNQDKNWTEKSRPRMRQKNYVELFYPNFFMSFTTGRLQHTSNWVCKSQKCIVCWLSGRRHI